MEMIIFISSIFCMVIGHIFKIKRWELFISVYEKPIEYNLLNAMTLGHTLNTIFPIRIGDIVRIILAGKKLKNGYPFSIATVIADLYIDFITVGIILSFLSLTIKKIFFLENLLYFYIFFIFIFFLSLFYLYINGGEYIKLLIKNIASIFNEKIELYFLYTTYLCFASIKDIIKNINKIKFTFFTFGIWLSYIMSYKLFAEFLQKNKYYYTSSDIFIKLFSGSVLYNTKKNLLFIWMIYLLLPLVICWIISLLLYKFYDKKNTYYKQILPQLNSRERLAFLKTYYTNENRENIKAYLEINKEVSILEDVSAGSNASTLLIMKTNGEFFFRKYAFDEDGIKLQKQIEWIEKHKNDIPLPKIEKKEYRNNYVVYDMKTYGNTINMFKYIHTMPIQNSWDILENILEDIKKLHIKNVKNSNSENIIRYISTKVIDNLKIIKNESKYIKNLEEYEYIFVNGEQLFTLKNYSKIFTTEYLKEIFSNDAYSDIHGDLTIENIICILNNYKNNNIYEDYYFIDPNPENIHNSPFLDYAKLLQSLHGDYEFLMMVSNVKIEENHISFMTTKSENYTQLFKRFYSYLELNFSKKEIISIFYHEIIHWLRLLPYKIRKNNKLAVIFYARLLKIIADIQEMEYEN